MKIRHPVLIRSVAWLGSWVLRGWLGSQRFRYLPLGTNLDPTRPGLRGHFIYVFWHENFLLPAHRFGRPDIKVLISQHADGEIIARICGRLGFGLVRGSSTRGSLRAVRELLESGTTNHLAITPDGPRGPRRRVQPGVAFLAACSGLPVVPVGVGYDRPWRLKSWDRFAVPKPGRRALLVSGEPIVVPAGAGRGAVEHYRARIEAELNALSEHAERWATLGLPSAGTSKQLCERSRHG